MPAPIAISERFADQCSPVISSNYETTGTITRASIDHLSLTDLNALFTPGGLFADLDAWFLHQIEMKACGVERYALYDWIMANADRESFRGAVSGTKVARGPSLMHPFILGKQNSVINKDHWRLVNGIANSAYTGDAATTAVGTMTAGPLTAAHKALGAAGDRVIRVQSRHGIPMEANWFRGRESIHIFDRASDGRANHGQWRVIASASNSTLTYVDVLVTSVNAGSSESFNPTPGASGTKGVIIVGVNNVNDFEYWCQNLPNIDPRKRVPFWIQTYRHSRRVDSDYLEVYRRLYDANPAFREFGDLDLAQRNKQDEEEMQRRFVHEFFWNKPISVNQTLNTWENLETITTADGEIILPASATLRLGGKTIAKRANFIGAIEQLRQCDRVFDLTNQPLNLREFLRLNNDIRRARRTTKGTVKEIDWFSNSIFRAHFMTAYVKYIDQEFNGQIQFPIEQGKLNTMGMMYDGYYFKYPAGIKINLISDDYFDDLLDEHVANDQESMGNVLWSLDLGKPGAGSIYWAQIAANRREYVTANIRELAKIDPTFACVMETVEVQTKLISNTGTVVVECPLYSAAIMNVANVPPVHSAENPTSSGYIYDDLY